DFFFQAEDGIRAGHVTGVQTCALPIYHHMGTTRMHGDPRKGVTNEYGEVHGVHNLFVVGSSVFPTGGYANPTLTLLALSLRTARSEERRVGKDGRLHLEGIA